MQVRRSNGVSNECIEFVSRAAQANAAACYKLKLLNARKLCNADKKLNRTQSDRKPRNGSWYIMEHKL